MTRKSLILGLILALTGLVGRAQITEVYRMGFETGETSHYRVVSGSANVQSNYAYAGSRALRMDFTGQDAVVEFDTIDFSTNNAWQNWELMFTHINNIDGTRCADNGTCCILEVRRIDQTEWTPLLGNQHYVSSPGSSNDFFRTGSFSRTAYTDWSRSTTLNGLQWRTERFTLNTILNNATLNLRKYIVRLTVKACVVGTPPSTQGWVLDNIVLRASAHTMTAPSLTMLTYPDMDRYPSSRPAYIKCDLTTQATQGICLDSVYLLYRLGTGSAPLVKTPMSLVSGDTNAFGNYTHVVAAARIPFEGYDTLITYRVVAKDNTLNHNTVTYPYNGTSFASYRHTRGWGNQASMQQTASAVCTDFPFPMEATHKSQYIFTKEMWQAAGYGPASITGFNIMTRSTVYNSRHSRFQIKMCNVPDTMTVQLPTTGTGSSSQIPYYTGEMMVTYDSALTLTQNANTTLAVNFQDTFFYAGESVLMQINYLNMNASQTIWQNTSPLSVDGFLNTPTTRSVYTSSEDFVAIDPWTNYTVYSKGYPKDRTPNMLFRATPNQCLVYDCGISGFVTPNDTVSANANTANDVTVTLTNYGERPITEVMLYYQVDGQYTDSLLWSGNLAGGASENVRLTQNQLFSVGYHEMRAWVGDTVVSGGTRHRDHEPLNDTCWTRMVSCSGPMSGERTVGGSGADFDNLEHFLYSVSICGVNGPLHVKLAPGDYNPIVVPLIPGTSMQNYVQFEPASGQPNSVRFRTTVTPSGSTANLTPLVDLRGTKYIRFSNIKFEATYNNNLAYPVRLGIASLGCQFHGCQFVEGANLANPASTITRANALLYSGGADSLTVNRCSFSRGAVGVSMVGPAADNLARGAVITRNYFENQGTNAIVLRNHISSVVDSNTMMDLLTSAGYLLLVQQCHEDVRVTRNTALITSGSSCMGVSELFGTAAHPALIANNMLVCNDDGTADIMTTPMFIIGAMHTKVLHNSVRMNAPQRAGIAAATFGGNELDQCYFYNNIVASMDTSNFAFSYQPWPGCTNYIGYNIYYSGSFLLNKYDGINCNNMNAWMSHINDGNSQRTNPAFLLLTPTDLRSYNQQVKGHGLYFPEVPRDIYDTLRSNPNPCVGAFEFSSVPYDFEIVSVEEPLAEYCDVPQYGVPIRAWIKNSGVNTYHYNPAAGSVLSLTFARHPVPGTMPAGLSGTMQVTDSIPGHSTVLVNLGGNLLLPPNGDRDTTYTVSLWLQSNIDPNPINDTTTILVTSRNHAPAVPAVNINSPYGQPATVNVSPNGLQNWYTNIYTSGRAQKSTLFWYHDEEETEPFHQGLSLTTDRLYDDTTFTIRQKRNMPVVRITEVQLKNTGDGVTYPLPMWMHAQTNLAVELTNVGDATAYLQGDTLMTVSCGNNGNTNSALNDKIYVMPNATIEPGKSLVVQFKTLNTACDTVHTLHAGATLSPQWNSNFAIIYRDKHGVADAVAFNHVDTTIGTGHVWTNQHVPNTVWQGRPIQIPDNTVVGYIRTAWPSNPNGTPVASAQFWQLASATNPMTLGTPDSRLVMFRDNGCPGEPSTVTITLTNRPTVDIMLTELTLPEGCDLDQEPISVTLGNYGAQPSGPVAIHYSVDGVLQCTDTLADLTNGATIVHTFSQLANLFVPSGMQHFDFMAWVDHLASDNSAFNDTILGSTYSSYTPAAPLVRTYDTIDYAARVQLTTLVPSADTLRWYDRFMNQLATSTHYTTPRIYFDDTFYVTALAPRPENVHIGNLAAVNNATAYPSPLNTNKLNGQEQYIYLASDLIAAGHGAGPINSLSFYLDTIRVNTGTVTYANYKVRIGHTTMSAFVTGANAAAQWQGGNLTEVYNQSNLTLTNANRGWVRFEFSEPFIWDGQSNILVNVVRAMPSAVTQGAQTRYTATTGVNTVYHKNDATAATLTNAPGNGSVSVNRPDVRFEFIDFGCEGPASPIYLHIENLPGLDATLEWPENQNSFSSCGPTNFDLVLRNGGSDTLRDYTIDYWVDGQQGSYTASPVVNPRDTLRVTVATPSFTPGRHSLKAIVTALNDTIPDNDTIQRVINVSFCAGTYTIGPADTNDYPSIPVALDTLAAAGVAGPVVFEIQSGVYSGQLVFGDVEGTDGTNTVTFQSASGNAEDVRITAPTTDMTAAANYVVHINGADYIRFNNLTIYAKGPAASSNAVQITDATNVRFNNAVIRVAGHINNQNSSCVIVNNDVHALFFENCLLDSGYYSVRCVATEQGVCDGFYFYDNDITNFLSEGIALTRVGEVYVRHNQIVSGVGISSRSLRGVTIISAYDGLDIERNNIVLFDEKNGGKRPITVSNYEGNNTDRGRIYNNMCVAHGTGGSGFVSQGITIDNCSFMNVYFNSVRIWAGTNAATTRALSVESTSDAVYVINNIFSNFSRGYAYFLNNAQNVQTSNYNVFFSDTNSATRKLAKIGNSELNNLDTLRLATGKEANSLFDQTYFVAPNDLHLAYGLYNEKALYLPDVVNDIDGEARPAIPSPCIGADEFSRSYHDVAVMQFITPTLGSTTLFRQANANVPWAFEHSEDNPVEADTLWVVVKLFNNGSSTETNLWWEANIVDSVNAFPPMVSPRRTIAEMQPGEIIYDTTFIPMPMGLIDTQHVAVQFSPDLPNDAALWNNFADTVFNIDMAFDFCMTGGNEDVAVETEVGYGPGCRLYEAPVSVRLTNKGKKPIPVDYPVVIGYEVRLPSTANYTVSQFPLVFLDTIYLEAPLEVNASTPYIPFSHGANLYPTGNSRNIDVRIRAWVSYQFDQKHVDVRNNVYQSRDTTASFIKTGPSGNAANPQNAWKAVTSKYTPRAPEGVNRTLDYATWDTLRATQSEVLPGNTNTHLPIKWYRDSSSHDNPFHAPAQYARSTWWETPQYYHDSVYYLACISNASGNDNGCWSDFSTISVNLSPRVSVDVAVMGEDFRNPSHPRYYPVASPRSRVYMTQCLDTVKVRLVNYGSQSASNFPVTYRFYSSPISSNPRLTLLAEVTETCRATIAPDSLYLFKFDSLITVPSENQWYYISCFTDHPNDMVRSNDTMRTIHQFDALYESNYSVCYDGNGDPVQMVQDPATLDITHVSFSSLWNDVPEVGRTYTNFAQINNPEVPVLTLIKGTTDTMMVSVANAGDRADSTSYGMLSVWLDLDRSGFFDRSEYDNYDVHYYSELLHADTIFSRHTIRFPITIPDYAALGYTRLRVVVDHGADTVFRYGGRQFTGGNVQDFLLYIEDVPVETDLALCGVVNPTGFQVDPRDSVAVTFKMSNKGSRAITLAEISYTVNHDGAVLNDNFTWTGNLEPGHSTTVELPTRYFDFGTHTYRIWSVVEGDTIGVNDTLLAQFHVFDTIHLVMDETFDLNRYHWYAPTGYTAWNRNVWQVGHSTKPHLNLCVSDSNVLATNLGGLVTAAHRGALCYYYTPIIDMMQIRPDTVSFWMAYNLADSNEFYIEFLDYERKWRVLGSGNDTTWYNKRYCVDGTSPGYSYTYFELPTARLSSDFLARMQFRLVFHANPGALACEGAVIDNFRIGRAQRAVDVGVTDIVYPTNPRFGEIIRPIVEITNFGYDTIRSTNLAYRPYGAILPKTATCETPIAPGQSVNFQFPDPFVVMADFPDTFDICAFTTVNTDIYWENDSTCKDFYLTPLDNDMGMVSFITPTARIVAGDSVAVTVRLRNYGQAPVSACNVSYRYNNLLVTERVDFEAILNRPLSSFEYFNYTFHQKCRATMGMMNFKSWVGYDADDYIYNDTIARTAMGISAIVDLQARAVIFDTSLESTRVQLVVDNVGALGVSDFDVAIWLDRDTSTLFTQSIHLNEPLPSLTTTTILFDTLLTQRSWPNGYFYATAYVTAANDNDRSNDTTSIIDRQYYDFMPIRILVEENRTDECRVRMEIVNNGNLRFERPLFGLKTTVKINGVTVCNERINPIIDPGHLVTYDFTRTIPKSPTRTYNGFCKIDEPMDDIDTTNNMTTRIDVVNYFGIPLVEGADGMSLDQNYPNPFMAETRIDFSIPTDGRVRFFVMDVMGRLVYQSEDDYDAGDHSITFSQTDLATGTYYYGIEMGDTRLMRKMVYKK